MAPSLFRCLRLFYSSISIRFHWRLKNIYPYEADKASKNLIWYRNIMIDHCVKRVHVKRAMKSLKKRIRSRLEADSQNICSSNTLLQLYTFKILFTSKECTLIELRSCSNAPRKPTPTHTIYSMPQTNPTRCACQ